MILFRRLLPILAALSLSPAFGAVTLSESTQVTLLRSTTTVGTYSSWDDCLARARELANASTATTGSVTYTCQTERRRVTANYSANPPPPAPVDCAVSDWSAWSAGAWGQCSAGSQSRTETRSRTVTTAAANGGAACPVLTESRTVSQACVVDPPPPPPTGSAFALYPALNLADIPWHNASGPWGPQVRIEAPALPVTSRSVSVSNLQAFNQAASVAGSRITITAGWPESTVATINANDVDVVIPAGVAIGAVELGSWPRQTPISRVRISGGGRMGQFRAGPYPPTRYTDVVLDGVDMNGSGFGGGETNQAFRVDGVTRIAILNVRAIAAGYIWLGGAKHVVIANSNFYHGAAARSQVGFVEGWGIRNGAGPITIVDSRIQGTRYHNLRPQSSGGAEELLYVARSVLVAQAEGRTAWLWNNLGAGGEAPNGFGQGAILENNDIYTYAAPGCGFPAEIGSQNVTWSSVRNNRFFGAGDAVVSQSLVSAASVGGGSSAGNTFAPLVALPSWGGRGDPTQVPLPAGLTLIRGEGACPGF